MKLQWGRVWLCAALCLAVACALALAVSLRGEETEVSKNLQVNPPNPAAVLHRHGEKSGFARHVRVGAVEQPGYMQPTGEGTMSGFDAEYVYLIANIAGFEADFISYPDYGKLLEAVERHEVDMAVGVARTPERVGRFLFTEEPFAKGELSLRVRAADSRYEYGSLADLRGMRIGVPAFTSMAYWGRKWAAENGLQEPVDYPSFEKLEKALYAGEVDGVIVGDFLNFRDTRVIAQFVTDTYHPIFPLDGQGLKLQVDRAMHRLNAFDPLLESRLRLKYKGGSRRRLNTAFTPEEQEYISSHPVITVAVLEDNLPYFKQEQGQAMGIIPDFFAQVATACGMEFVFQTYRTYEEEIQAVQEGRADIVGMVRMDAVVAKGLNLILSSSYFSQSLVSVQRDGEGNPRRIALAASDEPPVRQLLSGRGEEHEYLACRTVREAFSYFQSGRADAFICGMETAAWLLNHHTFSSYAMVNLSTQGWNLSSAMLPESHHLASILSKASMSRAVDMQGIILHSATSEADLATFLRRLPLPVLLLSFGLIFLLTGTAVGLAFYSRMQREKARTAVAEAGLKAAEQAKEAESAFLANMSHDLRTPLNGILGFAKLALSEPEADKRLEYLQKISYSAELMHSLVNDVLDMSKIEVGMMELHPHPTCLKEHFEHISAALSSQAAQKGLHFEAVCAEEIDSDKLWVMADQTRMEQVALNLLSNAIKYTPEGGTVRWESRFIDGDKMPPGRCRLQSIVSDTGLGMSEEFQQRMFEPFSQEHQHGTEKILGTGLGLAIVKSILDLMGASIEVESQLGKGTTITLTVDLELCTPPEDAAPKASDGKGPTLAGLRILLCEDNEINGELATMLLEQMGAAEVVWATDGSKGLEIFKNREPGSFDIILMDVRMPVMDGLSACRAIRALAGEGRPDAARIPIIAATADTGAEDTERCLAAGMTAHIAKPLEPEEMLACILRCHEEQRHKELKK